MHKKCIDVDFWFWMTRLDLISSSLNPSKNWSCLKSNERQQGSKETHGLNSPLLWIFCTLKLFQVSSLMVGWLTKQKFIFSWEFLPKLCLYERHISGFFQDWSGDASVVDDEFGIRFIVKTSSWIWDSWKTFLVGKWKTQSHISCMFSHWCLGWVVEVNERLKGVVIWGRKTFWVGRSSSGRDLKEREIIKTHITHLFLSNVKPILLWNQQSKNT